MDETVGKKEGVYWSGLGGVVFFGSVVLIGGYSWGEGFGGEVGGGHEGEGELE